MTSAYLSSSNSQGSFDSTSIASDCVRPEAKEHHKLNPRLHGFSCIRCQAPLPIDDYFEGCPTCVADGEPAAVRAEFDNLPTQLGDVGKRGMGRYAAWMPYSSWHSLGEGGTPCIRLDALANEVGTAKLFIKNEGQNPSGSHKDRVSCLTVTRAVDTRAYKIVAASSGNGGASLALYAAAARLQCSIVATPALSPTHRRAITTSGADLIIVEDMLERWRVVSTMIKERDWFPATNYLSPPVGSNHFGVEGLRTLAFELVEDLGPDGFDAVLVPTSRGDLIWGLFEGFRQLKELQFIAKIPRLFAVEPFPRICRVLNGEMITGTYAGTTDLFSIGGSTVTYQAVEAIRASGGTATVADVATAMRDQRRLAEHGCYAELSSAATLTGLERIRMEGVIGENAAVVLVVTSNGYKDTPNHTGLAL